MDLSNVLVYSSEAKDEIPASIWKHSVVTKMAYLLGVPKGIFQEGTFDIDTYEQMDKDKACRIIRNLCILRTSIFKNNKKIYDAMLKDLKNLSTLPEYIPQDSLAQLREDGIDIEKTAYKVNNYHFDINNHIKNRINNCKDTFPSWLNWEYVKDLFIVPRGNTEDGVVLAFKRYAFDKDNYPYQMYINWPAEKCGNVLYHDGRFVQDLYEVNGDIFDDLSKVRDASEKTKTSIYEFLEDSKRTSLIVDCENSDPYKLYAVLKNLDQRALLDKIVRIVLFDDFHTTEAWQILKDFTQIPVEYRQIDRVKENKSLVDQTLMITATKMTYLENIDSFILAASDSDYCALFQELPHIRYLVMVESNKCGPDIKLAMELKGIRYCYMDDFCTGNIAEIKNKILLKEIRESLDGLIDLNINTMIGDAIRRTRMTLTEDEEKEYYKRIKRDLHVEIDEDGQVRITTEK